MAPRYFDYDVFHIGDQSIGAHQVGQQDFSGDYYEECGGEHDVESW